MPELTPQLVVFLLCVGAYTVAAAVWDIRVKRIPNKLTLPVFGLGLVYQVAFNGLAGLQEGGLGFLIGFGFLFLLWMMGSGGGGDVKLMGALSVWLGWWMTLLVLVVSSLLASAGTFMVLVYSFMTKGNQKTKEQFLATADVVAGEPLKKETREKRMSRRALGYAVPVALATWAIVLWNLPKFPWVNG
jgi:prepilin peptidase CpaA